MILNRRMLLATLGLSLPAVAAEAATRKKTVKKPAAPKPAAPKVASHKPRRPVAKPHAQS